MMNATDRVLLQLLDCALHERPMPAGSAAGVEWSEMLETAMSHHIETLLLDPALTLPQGEGPAGETLEKWQSLALNSMMSQGAMAIGASMLTDTLAASGVKVVMLKGMALKALYPQPDLRTMSDLDLLAAPGEHAAAREAMESLGYRVIEREPGVDVMRGPDGVRVELHERLFDRTEKGFLARLNEDEVFPVSAAVREAVYCGESWVFPPDRHLLFLLLHMAKHLITTGFGLRQLADLSLFIEKRGGEIDFAALRAQTRALGIEGMTDALVEICRKYLSLPDGPWRAENPDEQAAEALLADILLAGVFGKSSKERTRSAAVVYRSFEAEDGDKGRLLRALFPSARTLKAPYLYARRHPWLLPAAWAHRLFNYARLRVTGRVARGEAAAGMRIADERLAMLDRLGMREGAGAPKE